MSATRAVLRLFRELLRNPRDVGTMSVLADALADAGHERVAHAYRWAATNKRWPFLRTGRGPDGLSNHSRRDLRERQVYDWNILIIDDSLRRFNVPEEAQLDRELIQAIRKLKDRRYGGIHRAFVLLAHALEATCVSGS
jgi:hypothetical protein